MKICAATGNAGKLRELRRILEAQGHEVVSQKELGITIEPDETGTTFEENALIKAETICKASGLPTIADDSGLCVDALDGRPGVYSARYAGEHATDADNCAKLLEEMKGQKNRSAHFTCVLSLAVPSGPALTWEASCAGELLEEKKGESGFGYDPLFFYPDFGKTFAEVPLAQKSSVSHRGKALREFASDFDKVAQWVRQRMEEIKPAKPDHKEFEHNDWSQERMV